MLLPSIVAPEQLLAMANLAAHAPPGDFAEVGVYQGGSASRLYEVAEYQHRKLHLFDTFYGTPFYVDGIDKHQVAEFKPPPDTLEVVRHVMPRANVYVGIYPDTHPSDLNNISFIHCDCDQYLSYKAVIRHMWPLVVPGGIMLFDDYPYLDGAKQAVEESFAPSQLRLCHQRFYVTKALV